ncbi:MAG: DUF308 domain-containing protein [Lachnospiraceae bacterium]|nr:DUF308 domain-containing protein [Lachnospiraceae bacterium]
MLRFFRELKASFLVSSCFSLALGIALLIWPGISAKVLCITLGTMLAIAGIVSVIVFLVTHDGTIYSRMNLTGGIVFLVIGMFIILQPEIVMTIIPIIIGIFIMVHGLYNFKQTVDLGKYRYDKWYFALILSILTIGLGIVVIINPFETAEALMMMAGAALVFDGVSDIWILSRIFVFTRKAKKELKKQIEEAEALIDESPQEVFEDE